MRELLRAAALALLAGCMYPMGVNSEDLVVVLVDSRTGAWVSGATVVVAPRDGSPPLQLGWRPPRDYWGGYDLEGRTVDLRITHPEYQPVERVVMVDPNAGGQRNPMRVDITLLPTAR